MCLKRRLNFTVNAVSIYAHKVYIEFVLERPPQQRKHYTVKYPVDTCIITPFCNRLNNPCALPFLKY